MGDCGNTHSSILLKSAKPLKELPQLEMQEVEENLSPCLQVFPYSENYSFGFWVFFFFMKLSLYFFFPLQKYSYHNVTWWAAALWTQPGRNSSWTAAAKVWAHPFFVPFTLVNDVHFNSRPAMAILNVQPIVVNHFLSETKINRIRK